MEMHSSGSFAEVLKRYRLAAGLSQEELAAQAGMSPRGVSDLERGKRTKPQPVNLRRLADARALSEPDRAAFLAAARRPVSPPPTAASEHTTSPSDAPSTSTHTSPPRLPTGTVTFLFTDIEGSTQLLHRLGASAYAAARDQHHRLLREAFASHGGVEVDTQGDAFFVAFPSAPDAVSAAAGVTSALAQVTWPEGMALRVRMGLHTGTPLLAGDHYVGLDVVRAARIAAAGHGGQTLLSEATRVLVEGTLPDGVLLRDLGAHRLKDLRQPEHLYQLEVPGLLDTFPSLKTLDARPHNLPIQPTLLLGRDEDVARLCALLRQPHVRLVTLTGPGGVGKTRLGLQVAAELVDDFSEGVYYVRLSRLSDPHLVLPTIAQTLGLRETASRPIGEVLREYVRTRTLLLLLDNFEHVSPAATDLAALLEASPGLRALVTSRVRLRLRGEKEAPVAPLALPQESSNSRHAFSVEELTQSPAVALFLQRAQDVRPDFQLSAANAASVAAICARLDGLPLALELAAARVKALPPAALLIRLERALPLLGGGAREVDERQQTMRNTLTWSYALLAPEEQRLFRRLAVFVGGWTLEAAEAICAAPAGAEPLVMDTLEGLIHLVDHSLVQQREEGGEPRFGMLHIIREFALEQLEASGEAEALWNAHATHTLTWAEEPQSGLRALGDARWLAKMERENENLRAAVDWACDRGEVELALRLVVGFAPFWAVNGHYGEGRRWLEEALASDRRNLLRLRSEGDDDSESVAPFALERAWACNWAARIASNQFDYEQGYLHAGQALTWARASGNTAVTMIALSTKGLTDAYHPLGNKARGMSLVEEALALGRRSADPDVLVWALADNLVAFSPDLNGLIWVLGDSMPGLAGPRGDLDQARTVAEELLALAKQLEYPALEVYVVGYLAGFAFYQNDLAMATAHAKRALRLVREHGIAVWARGSIETLGWVAERNGEGERAARLLGAVQTLAERQAILGFAQRQESQLAQSSTLRTLGEDVWRPFFTQGQALSLEGAIAEALGEYGQADERAAVE